MMRQVRSSVAGSNVPGKTLPNQEGFTLLEILVAVTILAVGFATLFQLFGGTLRKLEETEQYARATLFAESRMEELLFAEPLLPPADAGHGTFDGTDGFEWKSEVEEYLLPIGHLEEDTAELPKRPVTYQVKVTVTWKESGREKKVSLTSLKTVVEEVK